MPTVLRLNGFRVLILLPPREHGPAHVHVLKGDAVAVIELAHGLRMQRTLRIEGKMKAKDVTTAEKMVKQHTAMLLTRWRKIHG